MKIERVIVSGERAVCSKGTVPSVIRSLSNEILYSDGNKVVLETDIGNPFGAGGFGVCSAIPNSPKPCLPAVLRWSGMPGSFVVSGKIRPLTNNCKGDCVQGGCGCIKFF